RHPHELPPLPEGRSPRSLQGLRCSPRLSKTGRPGQRSRAAESPLRYQRRGLEPERRRLVTPMSRSKHTDPKAIRAARRLRAPREGRGVGDLRRRRELGRNRKVAGAEPGGRKPEQNGQLRFRIVVRESRPGFHHPADKQDVLEMLKAVGPVAFYGLRSIELARSPANASVSMPVFGRYYVPGRIILFEQPWPPWRLPGLLKGDVARRLERAGAVVT